MTNSLSRNGAPTQQENRPAHWAPYRELFGFDPFQALRSNWAFDYEVVRIQNGYQVEVPVPGYKPEQVEITFKDGVLSVNGKAERRNFSRSFSVPDDVDDERITANVSDGMLVLKLERQPEAQPKRIAVGGS